MAIAVYGKLIIHGHGLASLVYKGFEQKSTDWWVTISALFMQRLPHPDANKSHHPPAAAAQVQSFTWLQTNSSGHLQACLTPCQAEPPLNGNVAHIIRDPHPKSSGSVSSGHVLPIFEPGMSGIDPHHANVSSDLSGGAC